MATLKASRTAQWPLVAEFTFNYNDDMLNTSGVSKNFGSSDLDGVFDVINLPPNAVVIGGDVTVETLYGGVTGTATISVGDSGSATRYANGVDLKTAARTALTLTGYRGTGQNLRVTLALQDNATSGKATVRVEYIIQNRSNEVVSS